MLTETNMAGKTKKQGGRSPTPGSARGMMGHLGLKSNALAPVDSKLSSQYMVLDHMTAHYKNLNKVKATVDTTPPKAWLISQKARDRARREAVKNEYKRRNQWLSRQDEPATPNSARDRDDMIAMMESISGFDDDLDTVDVGPIVSSSEATSKINRLNSEDIDFVNRLVTDSVHSPSRYHSQKLMKSYIPSTNAKVNSKQHRHEGGGHMTPRGMSTTYSKQQGRVQTDIIDKQANHFTQEKPFTPRTLKSKPEVQSRLSTFKYYNPPKKSIKEGPVVSKGGSVRGGVRRGSYVSRPDTAYPDSVDLMNETLMSRDMNHDTTPSGVPPLDISLDADNVRWMKEHQKTWLNEQNRKAQLRASARTRSDAGSDFGSMRYTPVPAETMNGTRTLSTSQNLTNRYPNSYTLMKVEEQEEELKYLEFLTDVTNDVLDRGIFTNRVLKQVFANHMEKKRHVLKPEKMHEMLGNLRQDLGIPPDHEDDGLGMNSTRIYSPDPPLDVSTKQPPGVAPRSRRKQTNDVPDDQRANLPHLRPGRNRPGSSGEGKPPLPRPVSRGSWSRPGSAASNHTSLHEVKEEAEDSSITFTYSDEPSSGPAKADILKIDHDGGGETFQPIGGDDVKDEDHGMFEDIEPVNSDDLDKTLTEQYEQYVGTVNDDDSRGDGLSHDDVNSLEHADMVRSEPDKEGSVTDLEHLHHTEPESNLDDESEHLPDPEYEDAFETETETPREPPKPTPRTRSSARSTLSSSEFTPRSVEQTQTSDSVTVSELDYVDDF